MAKDILWFHAVIWPAMLMAMGRPLPRVIYAHAYFVAEGRKMSKSLGNFIEIDQLAAYSNWIVEAERKQADKKGREPRPMGIDPVRWYLATQGPLGANDADFAHAKFVEVYNADLANGIGNCASRVGNMIGKYFDNILPANTTPPTNSALATACAGLEPRLTEAFDQFDLSGSTTMGTALITAVDGYINETRPFSLAKTIDEPGVREQLGSILYQCAEAIRIASLLLYPALPNKMAELWRNWHCSPLNDPADPNSGFIAPLADLARWGGPHSLKPGQQLDKFPALFMRASTNEPPPSHSDAENPITTL